MLRIITVNRKYLAVILSIIVICAVGFTALRVGQDQGTSTTKTEVVPEVKMLGITVDPAPITKDITYGSLTLKGVQIIPTKTFDLIATVQNTTGQKMYNVPVELEVTLLNDETQKVSKVGNIASLDPGAAARVTFKQVKALGDALGKDGAAGQHLITLRVKPNPEGGVNQTTEASFRFMVDTTVKNIK